MRYLLLLITLFDLLYAKEKEVGIYDFNVTTISGKEISMSKYKGQVLLIVNVASECGFTPQYEGLEKLYETYRKNRFMVLGFPSDQFAKQEPGSNDKILFFCQSKYDVQFDMFAKIDVNGDNTLPLYQYLKSQQSGFLWTKSIKWNFTKFLIDRSGRVVARYGSATKPESIKEDIEALLKQ
jgi:glutathione peroxidase